MVLRRAEGAHSYQPGGNAPGDGNEIAFPSAEGAIQRAVPRMSRAFSATDMFCVPPVPGALPPGWYESAPSAQFTGGVTCVHVSEVQGGRLLEVGDGLLDGASLADLGGGQGHGRNRPERRPRGQDRRAGGHATANRPPSPPRVPPLRGITRDLEPESPPPRARFRP